MNISYSLYFGLSLILTAIAVISFVPRAREYKSIIILLIILPSLLPLLPDQPIDPWSLFNPRKFCILIVTISIIQFGGYMIVKLLGERIGLALSGFIGGLISSTVVFASLKTILHSHRGFEKAIMASAVLAVIAMLVEISAILFVASPVFFIYVLKPIVSMMVAGLCISTLILIRQKKLTLPTTDFTNPVNIKSVLQISAFLSITLIIIAIAKRYLGASGIIVLSFLGGLFEIHGLTLASALLYIDHNLAINDAAVVLYVAIAASFVSKFFLLATLTPYRFALVTSLLLLTILSVGTLSLMV